MAVGPADAAGQRYTLAVNQNMVFGPFFPAIRGVGAGIYPPKTARTLEESMAALDQSSLPAWSSLSSSTRSGVRLADPPRAGRS